MHVLACALEHAQMHEGRQLRRSWQFTLASLHRLLLAAALAMPKKFAVVLFPLENDDIAVVPISWVTADEGHCLWPCSTTDVRHLTLKETVPGTTEEGWQRFPIKLVTKCRTYRSAREKAKAYEDTSHVESSAVSGPEEQLQEVGSPELQSPLPPPAPPVSVRQCATASQPLAEVRQQLVAEEQEAVLEPVEEQQCQATGNLLSQQEGLGTSAAGGLTVDPERSGSPDVANNLLLRTIRLLVEVRQEQRHGFHSLRAEMQQLSARLDNVEALLARRGQPAPPAAPLPDLPELPATSLEELEAAEAALEDKDVASALRDHLDRRGGRELREVAVNVLTAIMNNDVQRLFSMHGKKGKRAFASLRLCKVATDVISRKAGVDIAAVEGFIKKWLPGSTDRGGGRKTRFEQSLTHHPLSLATTSTPSLSES
uniref:DUF4806 domain-containing protein n=1 Tax=Rhipicephalus zambeziensis TaxID=60191 RepID=A0A224YSV5_9ACAR